MKYELKDFQKDAAEELLGNMRDLMTSWEQKKKLGSCCLSAPTGAGKTVIAGAVIEALLEGSQVFGNNADPDACILWVTDLPSLADQTRIRLMDATDVDVSRIEMVTNTFTKNHSQLERGQVYFLHRQLLGKNRLLSGGGESLSFWQVLRNTIDSGVHLYLFLDEAHRGIGSAGKRNKSQEAADQTIYAQIIDGERGDSPVPVVVGISATPKRFEQAMKDRKGRTQEATTRVNPADVQASGLLKETILLKSPTKATSVGATYLSDACRAFKKAGSDWEGWCAKNNLKTVIPLMVVQVEDKTSDKAMGELVRDIRGMLPALGNDAFAHSFGDHNDRFVGGIEVPYISPESVQDETQVRVLFAKEAISTGWDCPRAEVIYSMRPHSDVTYITQLLGRMVRTPLAMLVDDETLNSVWCYLPRFDEKATGKVAKALTSEDSDDGTGISRKSGRRVLVDPVDVEWNHELGVDDAFISIRKVIESHHPMNEIQAAVEYSGLLARYDIDKGAQKKLFGLLIKTLHNEMVRYSSEYEEALRQVRNITSRVWKVTPLGGDDASEASIVTQAADAVAVASARRRADSELTTVLTNKFFNSERAAHKSDLETNQVIAAAASVPEIVASVRGCAMAELNRLVLFYSPAVDELPMPARICFASVLSANGINREVNLRIIESDRQDREDTKYVYHVLSEYSSGEAWIENDSDAEGVVITRESKRPNFVAFYRNPSAGTGDHVLSIVYQHPLGGHRTMHPDFIFFERDDNGVVMPSIIDPHGTQFVEARAKLEGLAKYVQRYGNDFLRVWAINGDATRVLDMKDAKVQNALLADTKDVDTLYKTVGFSYN